MSNNEKPNNKLARGILDNFAPKFLPIYLPMIVSVILFAVGVLVALITETPRIPKIIMGASMIILATSGIGQIKLKIVPGYPKLRGGCAIIFGIIFIILFTAVGIGIIFFE